MTHPSFDFGDVDAFTTGTIGAPGQRIFFLQVRADGRVLTLKCEKQQVAALGQYLERLLDDLPAPEDAPLPTALELTEPADPAWIVGQLAVAWEAERDRFVVVVEEMEEVPDAGDLEGLEGTEPADLNPLDTSDRARVRLEVSRGQALAFAGRAAQLVASGRPACRFCGLPMDPDGQRVPPDELKVVALARPDPGGMALLECGDVEVEGRMPWSSNATFLVALVGEGSAAKAIYKPGRGERPLWDFPNGLYRREVAAYRLSEALGWGLVPPTIIRTGPLGEGSFQLFIEADFEQHYFTLFEQREDLHPQLMAMCAFDLLANNTDRKSGHVLLGPGDRIWGIDQGLCFSAEFKLRTVIWDFGGDPIPSSLLPGIERLAASVPLDLAALLDDDEVEALQHRARIVLREPTFPVDTTGRRYPWPMV